jgi:hypothetical protein
MDKSFRLTLNESIVKYILNMNEKVILDKVEEVFNPPPPPKTWAEKYLGINYSNLPNSWRPAFEEYKKHEAFVKKMLKPMPSSYSFYSVWINKFLKLNDISKFHNSEFILMMKGLL